MKNRFIDLLIEKDKLAEKKAMTDSFSIYPDDDPTQYNPWEDRHSEDENKE